MSDTSTRPALMPADTPDYMIPAWVSFIRWAIGNAELLNMFETETRFRYKTPRNGVEAEIDQATGYGKAYVEAFVRWANEGLWGPLNDKMSEGEPVCGFWSC